MDPETERGLATGPGGPVSGLETVPPQDASTAAAKEDLPAAHQAAGPKQRVLQSAHP